MKDWVQEFNRVDRENPDMYRQFVQFATMLVSAGRTRVSHGTIIERMRWESAISVGPVYKINQNFGRPMAERFIAERPHLEGLFEFRKRGDRAAFTCQDSLEDPCS